MTKINQRRPLDDESENDAKRLKASDKENRIIDLTAEPPKSSPKPPIADLVKNMLKLDPGALVDSCKTDDVVLAQLKAFVDGLQTNIKLVDEGRAKAKAEKTRLDKEKEEQARRAKRQALIDSNKCFSCGKVCDSNSGCSCFKEEGASGHGSRCCDDCNDKNENLQDCLVCSANIDKRCCDYQTCAGCEEAHICNPCYEKEDRWDSWKTCDDCGDDFCSHCNEDFETGCNCKAQNVCEGCANANFQLCECGDKVCDKCKKTLECGNDVVLCYDCDYQCPDCDYCAGYYR